MLLSGCKVQSDIQKPIEFQKEIGSQIIDFIHCIVKNSDLAFINEDIMWWKDNLGINDSDNKMILEDLDNWIGKYKFFESASVPNGPIIIMDYEIEIYKTSKGYYAEILIDGQTTMVRVRAKVTGNENFIHLKFLEYLPDHKIGLCSEIDDILISFERKNEMIYTYWGKIEPMLVENEKSGKVFLKKLSKT